MIKTIKIFKYVLLAKILLQAVFKILLQAVFKILANLSDNQLDKEDLHS